MSQAQKNKMFALAFGDEEGASVTQDSVSYNSDTLEARVYKEFEKDKAFGNIDTDATLEKHVDSGDPSIWVYRYDEDGENILYAQIEKVDVL